MSFQLNIFHHIKLNSNKIQCILRREFQYFFFYWNKNKIVIEKKKFISVGHIKGVFRKIYYDALRKKMHREREKLKLFQVCVKKKMNCRVKEKSSYFHVSFIFYNMHVNLVVGIAQLNEKKKTNSTNKWIWSRERHLVVNLFINVNFVWNGFSVVLYSMYVSYVLLHVQYVKKTKWTYNMLREILFDSMRFA